VYSVQGMTGEQRKRLLQEEAAAVFAVHHDKQVCACTFTAV
jgi:hypothetical protein